MRGGELWSPEVKLCFSLLQRIPSPPALLEIHAFILRRELDGHLPLLTLFISAASDLADAAISAAASSAVLRHSRRLFDRRRNQDAFLCNAMIRSLARHRLDPLSLYRDLRRGPPNPPFSPDSFTFPFLLKSCADPSSQREGPQLHGQILKMGFGGNVFSGTGLVEIYAKFGSLGHARKVFDEMTERSPASWTSMTVAYVKAGDMGSAIELFREMPVKDTAAFNAMIDAFVKLGDVRSARRLLDEMPERTVVSWTSLMYGYCKVGDMESARGVFDGMRERNLFSWNVMIGGYCQNRQPRRALELFRELQSDSCPLAPDEVTVVSVIPAVADMGVIDLGRWIHSFIRRQGLDHGASVSTALVDMYAKCGDISEAKRVFDGIPTKCVATWNAMINGLAMNGRAHEALGVFGEMLGLGVYPNDVTMIGVLSACSHGGLVDQGRHWFDEMEGYGIDPRVEHYGCMVDLLGRGGYLEEAERLADEMPCGANGIILSSLLSACFIHRDVGRAERVMGRAAELEPWNVRNYVMLRNLYAAEKRWDDVERVKGIVNRFGGKREAGCSVVDIGGRALEFVSGDNMHPEIQRVIGQLKLHMKGKIMDGFI